MRKIKPCFFIIFLLITIILFSWQVMGAPSDACNCDIMMGVGCPGSQFCDENEQYSLSCYPEFGFNNLCVNCRLEGQTCYVSYAGDDCCGLNCTREEGVNYRCCPDNYKWNTTTSSCQSTMNPCQTNGHSVAGDNYCTSLATGKDKCCGTANNGHCEACCDLADCSGVCRYCNTGGAIGTWNCAYQDGQDLKDDCLGIYQVCDGSGGCEWIDDTPSAGCSWPTEPVFKDEKIYELIMCTYNCAGQCPQPYPYVAQPNNMYFCESGALNNPFWGFNTHGCTWCLSDAVPDCIDVCVVTSGEGCQDYRSIGHPEGCCEPDDECSNNHCCPSGTAWNGTACGGCSASSTFSTWICANPHSGGIAGCECGAKCYTVSGVDVYCQPNERCVKYHPDPLVDPDMPTALKACSVCKPSTDCCVGENGAATLPSQCCSGLYLNGTHCCQKGWEWDAISLSCIEQDPCYREGSYPLFCPYRAPDCSYLPQPEWWYTPFNPYCVNTTYDRACCFMGAGLYGFIIGEEYYYWHEYEPITVY